VATFEFEFERQDVQRVMHRLTTKGRVFYRLHYRWIFNLFGTELLARCELLTRPKGDAV